MHPVDTSHVDPGIPGIPGIASPRLVKPQPWPVTVLPGQLRLQLPGYALVTLELRELPGWKKPGFPWENGSIDDF